MNKKIDHICKDPELLCSALVESGLTEDQKETLSFMYKGTSDEAKEFFRSSFSDELEDYCEKVFDR